MKMAIKAVFFDIGGTLITSTSVLKRVIWEMDRKQLESMGYKFTIEQLKEAQEEADRVILKKYGNPHKKGVLFAKEMYNLLGVEIDDETAKGLEEEFWKEIYSQVNLIKNSAEILTYLKNSGYNIIAVTNNTIEKAHTVLKNFGIMHFFDDVITSEEFGLKSTLVPFRVAMERFNLKPEQVLMVGNNLFEDVIGAKKLGIRSVLVDFKGNLDEFYKSYAKVEDQIKPDYVVKDLIEIKGILKGLNGV